MLFTFQAVATVFQIAKDPARPHPRLAVIGVKRLLATVAIQFHEDRFGVAGGKFVLSAWSSVLCRSLPRLGTVKKIKRPDQRNDQGEKACG